MLDAAWSPGLRPFPRDRLKSSVRCVRQGPEPARTPLGQDAPDARQTATLTEAIRALRNENWHLQSEVDLLKLALQNEGAAGPQRLQEKADERLAEVSARCRASEEEVSRLKKVMRNCEAECKAWATLHQAWLDNHGRQVQESSSAPPATQAAASPLSSPPAHGQGSQVSAGTGSSAGVKALFLAFEEELQVDEKTPEVHGQGTGCVSPSQYRGQRAQAREWLTWRDREAALKKSLREREEEVKALKLAHKRLDVALTRSERGELECCDGRCFAEQNKTPTVHYELAIGGGGHQTSD